MTPPPYDLDLASLNSARIARIAGAMQAGELLAAWMSGYQLYQQDAEVRENSAKQLRLQAATIHGSSPLKPEWVSQTIVLQAGTARL